MFIKYFSSPFLLVLSLVVFPTSAQMLIPQVGVAFSENGLTSSDTDPHETKVSFRTGVTAGCGFRMPVKKFIIQTGLYFTQKGSRSEHEAKSKGSAAYHQLRHEFDFVEAPLSVLVPLDKEDRQRAYLRVGATFSRLIGGKVFVYYYYPPEPAVSYNVPVRIHETRQGLRPAGDYYVNRPLDIGIHVGLGYRIKEKLQAELVFTQGTQKFDFFYKTEGRLRTISLSLGYLISLRKGEGRQ